MSLKKKIKRCTLVLAILLLIGISVILYLTKDEINATSDNVEAHLESFYNSERMGGFAVSVFTKDSILYSKGFGYADIEKGIPYTTKTQQYIASVSKTSIGIALLKAQELGFLKITDAINMHLPFEVKNLSFPNDEITIAHLATHTSSLNYNEAVVESLYIEDSLKNKLLRPFMENYFVNGSYGKVLFTKNKPGDNWNYSNIGAALAAYIIEYKSGLSYDDFTKKYIFKPLEMKSTHWFASEADSNYVSSYYEPQEAGGIKKVENNGVILYPARDMHTNVEDLTRYGQSILGIDAHLLTKDSYELMLSKRLKGSVSGKNTDNQGIFWMIDRNQYGVNYQLTGYNGGDYCINTIFQFDPVTEIGYVFI
ncbi:beta-lactamase family protein [Maribacter algarum]|uniref:Beta-lactamase family protein n=1 Tax=Maribacter algarum (ex Zhang et al. 2020) TaxID=2578118 RepID=A0A5S3QGX6_9FLAO|nr:serine hydrolase domain-containing protein [Maribacter algarum]TMM56785.1 beta-lactamase family protein [Maribacter algarum]